MKLCSVNRNRADGIALSLVPCSLFYMHCKLKP